MDLAPTALADLVLRLRTAGCVFAEDEAYLLTTEATTPAELAIMVERRVAGVPLEQVLGWARFSGLRIQLEAGVFVPRRRTEFLVDQAAALAGPEAVVVDLCCGSGAVAAALSARCPTVEVHAVDVDPVAVRCARRNLVGRRAHVHLGDLFEALPASLQSRVDVIVANAPYVPTAAIAMMPPEARLHEPRTALDGGADGLHVQRRIAGQAASWLAAGGHLLIETSEGQGAQTAAMIVRGGLATRTARSDELDCTVVVGTNSERRAGSVRPVTNPRNNHRH